MDAEQRYIEEANFDFEEMGYGKVIQLGNLGYHLAMSVHDNAHKIPTKEGIIQRFGVMVSHNETDVMFQVKIYHQNDEIPILVDVDFITVDEYLDLINQNKSITHEKNNTIGK